MSQTFEERFSPRKSSNVLESLRKSANIPAADFRGITDNFYNLLPNVRGANNQLFRGFASSQIFTGPVVREGLWQLAGLFADIRGLTRTAKSPRLSRTFEDSSNPRKSAIGFLRTFVERNFSHNFKNSPGKYRGLAARYWRATGMILAWADLTINLNFRWN